MPEFDVCDASSGLIAPTLIAVVEEHPGLVDGFAHGVGDWVLDVRDWDAPDDNICKRRG